MSRPGALRPGPGRKTPAWRGGSVALGTIVLLWLADVLTGGFISLLGLRGAAVLLVLGLALSVPYGRAWLEGRLPPPQGDFEAFSPAEVHAREGATYIVVTDGRRRGGVRTKELSPGWYVLYTIFWRAPMALGDYVLVGVWTALAAAMGRERASHHHGEAPDASELPDPARSEF